MLKQKKNRWPFRCKILWKDTTNKTNMPPRSICWWCQFCLYSCFKQKQLRSQQRGRKNGKKRGEMGRGDLFTLPLLTDKPGYTAVSDIMPTSMAVNSNDDWKFYMVTNNCSLLLVSWLKLYCSGTILQQFSIAFLFHAKTLYVGALSSVRFEFLGKVT